MTIIHCIKEIFFKQYMTSILNSFLLQHYLLPTFFILMYIFKTMKYESKNPILNILIICKKYVIEKNIFTSGTFEAYVR